MNSSEPELSQERFSSSDCFRKVRYAPAFVDKSLLLIKLFTTEEKLTVDPAVLVTAPRKFGKSVNMNMVHDFLDRRLDDGDSNEKLFDGLEIMKPEHEEFRNGHFGKYVVLKASFLCTDSITTKQEALRFSKTIVHDAYKEHRYLCNSGELSESRRAFCERWCHEFEYLECDDDSVSEGLKVLSELLSLHYKRDELKVFVLIDDYDSLYNRAMFGVKDPNELRVIIENSNGMIAALVRENDHVAGAFLTGISHIRGFGLPDALDSVSTYRFLRRNNKFAEYYGFKKDEVEKLYEKFAISDDVKTIADKHYKGYGTEDGELCMYNPWSVVKFLETGIVDSYWIKSGTVESVSLAFKINSTKTNLENTIMSSAGVISVALLDTFDMNNIFQLHSLIGEIQNSGKFIPTCRVFFTFLFEQGYLYLTFKKRKLKIPNAEIKKELQKMLATHFTQKYDVNNENISKCADAFNAVFSSATVNYEHLQNLKEKLEQFVTPLLQVPVINRAVLQQALFIPLFATGFTYYTENKTSRKKKRPDSFLYKDDFGVIMEIQYRKNDWDIFTDSKQALRHILDKKYFAVFTDDKYFKCVPKNYLLIGLSFDAKLKVSMHCLQSGKAPTLMDHTSSEVELPEKTITALVDEADTVGFEKE